MYIIESGFTDNLTQYECKNIPQVKNIINKLTKTTSQNSDWKDICSIVKKSSSDSVDYICFIDNIERECSVNIAYDNSCKSYFVWIEI